MKGSSLTATILVSLAGAAFARPSPQTSGLPLPACVSICINQVVGTGACTDATDVTCLCSSDALRSCVQSDCPPSFVDSLGQFCGTGPFSSSTESASTSSGSTETPTATTSATSIRVSTSSSVQSPRASAASTGNVPTTTQPAGNAGDPTVNASGLKAILTIGLAFVAGALLV